MTDFGLTNEYHVHNGLDQGEVFSPLLWHIFYDLLLCEVKKQESICGYKLISYFVSKTGQVESQVELTLFLAASAFVDNTIWVSSSQAATQHILNVAKTKVATKTPNLTVLEFCCAIYTQNQSDLGLSEGCCPAESVLTYYINARINYYIGKEKEPHDAKLGLYRELSQYTTKEVAVIATTIVKIHREIEQYTNKNFLISTGNTRECANKTKENLETNQESNQQKLETPAQTPKKTVIQSIKKQRIYSPEDKSYHFSPENKIQIPLGAASSSTSTPQTPRTPSYTDKIKQCNWGDIPITRGYSLLFENPLFQPKFRMGFENHEEESESESEKETSKKTITRPVTRTSSQSKNQETRDQEEEPDIREATFRNT
ncbi:hypothetical protein G9A89_004895 [Geosiphon pyriformis]|nr:hypothetical protein G9A89_004895 [Geosiphon pyriformis]